MAMAAMTLHPPKPRASTPTHPPVFATSNDGVLPLDLLYEILLRLPAKPVCRFRAVCRPWRSLLCHPDFIAAAHNPGPLLAVGVATDRNEVNVVNMEAGRAVKPSNVASNEVPYAEVRGMDHDRVVCVLAPESRVRLVDLANDVTCLLPDHTLRHMTWCMLGRAASTGERKVLVVAKYQEPQVCKILTLGHNADSGWRDVGHPPLEVLCHERSFAVVHGLAYFLSKYWSPELRPHKIVAFDLSRETWRAATFRAPVKRDRVSLAELNGHLVASYYIGLTTSVEMWFLVDMEKPHWSKRYTITIPRNQSMFPQTCYVMFAKPLAVLDHGRTVMWIRVSGDDVQNDMLLIYDQQTQTFMKETKLPKCSSVSVFTWSLLHSGERSAIDMAAERLLMRRQHHRSSAPSSIKGTSKKRSNK